MSNIPSELRVAWFVDIFDEISGIFVETTELLHQAHQNQIPWYPITCYTKELNPFMVFKPIIKLSTSRFYKDSNIYIPNIFQVIKYLKKNNITFIISNTAGTMGLTAVLCAIILRIPWVDIYHTDIQYYMRVLAPPSKRFLVKIGLPLWWMKIYWYSARAIFVRTLYSYHQLIDMGIVENKLRLYEGSVDIKQYNPCHKDRSVWKKFNIDPNKCIILFVGRISKEKNLEFLLDIFRETQDTTIALVVVGYGPIFNKYNSYCLDNNNIHFLNKQTGQLLANLYASADVFVSPSSSETLGKTIIEAMASGLPVLVSNQGGPSVYIKDHVSGRVFEGGNYHSFSQVFYELLNDKKKLRKLGNEALLQTKTMSREKCFSQLIHDLTQFLHIKH